MHTSLLIVGAGPFGLAMAAHAREIGIDHVVVGDPMSFWRRHMPTGMVLRSGCQWHLDPDGDDTIERFLETLGRTPAEAEPLPLGLYLEYAEWFADRKTVSPRRRRVDRLAENGGVWTATLDNGTAITADRVLLALGFAPFAHTPSDLAEIVPPDASSHTCDHRSLDDFRDRRVLIVGGRQSAFESAALMAEAGARRVYVCHRHETPAFTTSDWTWVGPLLERIGNDPGWLRGLSESERRALDDRFWTEGRLKLEPWLGPRVTRDEISIRPLTRIVGAEPVGDGLRVRLEPQDTIDVDHVLYATGYEVDLARVPFLSAGDALSRIERREGFPVLDTGMETTARGLHVTSLPATRDFGLFFAFTAAVRASARIVGRACTGAA